MHVTLHSAKWSSSALPRTSTLSLLLSLAVISMSSMHVASSQKTVPIKSYFAYTNFKLFTTPGGKYDYPTTLLICAEGGGNPLIDQTLASHVQLTEKMNETRFIYSKYTRAFLGGDMMYSVLEEKDPSKRCVVGAFSTAMNCIYQWNQGRFATPGVAYLGSSFYRGSLYTVPGGGSLNGYPSFWQPQFPSGALPYLQGHMDTPVPTTSGWTDYWGTNLPDRTIFGDFVVVCETQHAGPYEDGAPSWISKNWFVPVVAVIVVLILFFFGCFAVYCYAKKTEHDEVRETSRNSNEESPNPYQGFYDEMEMEARVSA